MKRSLCLVYKLYCSLILMVFLFTFGCKQKTDNAKKMPNNQEMQQNTEPSKKEKEKEKEKNKEDNKEKNKEKEPEQEVEKDKDREKEKGKEKEGEKDREKDKESEKDKEKEKDATGDEGKIVEEITIEVKADAGALSETAVVFAVKKGSAWSDVKNIATTKLVLREEKEIKEWRSSDGEGVLLEDGTTFEVDTVIFAVTKGVDTSYTVEHWKENLEDENYTKVQDATETKNGEAGKDTEAVAREYTAFLPETVIQQKIKADGSTLVKVYYKMKRVSLVLNLQGGNITPPLKDGEGVLSGKKILQGKPGADVKVESPTKTGLLFYGWNPPLPAKFSSDDVQKEYVANWSENIRVYIKGDERLEIKKEYLDFAPGEAGIWQNVSARIEAQVSLKPEWANGDYEIYDWKLTNYDGEKIENITEISQCMTCYARTNYNKFKWNAITQNIPNRDRIVGYEGTSPRGKLIIPRETVHLLKIFIQGCNEITGIDVSECENLETLQVAGVAITSIDLSKCPRLMHCDLNDTKLVEIDVMQNPNLTWLSLQNTGISRLDLPECRQLGVLNLTNTEVAYLDTSKCRGLHGLFLSKTQIKWLDVSYFPNLHTLNLAESKIKELNVRYCSKLEQLFLEKAPIEQLDVEGCRDTLRILYLFNSQIQNLDLSHCKGLQRLWAQDTPLKDVAISGCISLLDLNLSKTQVERLDVSTCKKLQQIILEESLITKLNASGCTDMELIFLDDTPIEEVDISECPNLFLMMCGNCKNLKNVNLENCPKFESIGWTDSGDPNVKYLPFVGCVEAVVRVPSSLLEVLSGAFGKDDATWCKEVHVPNGNAEIKQKVVDSGYPADRIKGY